MPGSGALLLDSLSELNGLQWLERHSLHLPHLLLALDFLLP